MVTAKREITTEEERYGGYAARRIAGKTHPASATLYQGTYNANDEVLAERYDDRLDSGIVRGREDARRETVVIKPPTMPSRRRESTRVDAEDLYPTDATMRSIKTDENVRPDAAPREDAHRRVKLNTRGKLIVAGYAVVLVALIAVIIINAVALGGLTASVSALNGQVIAATEEHTAKNVELSGVSRPDFPEDMSTPENTLTFELPDAVKTPQAPAYSNWFDRLCDALSGMFGG